MGISRFAHFNKLVANRCISIQYAELNPEIKENVRFLCF